MNIRSLRCGVRSSGGALCACLMSVVLAVASPAVAQEEVFGDWGPVQAWPMNAEHAVHMPTGQILVWQHSDVRLWNPAKPTSFPSLDSTFINPCAGHAALPDGSVLIVGGGTCSAPVSNATVFQLSRTFKGLPPMPFPGRFYPTCTTLPDGTILVSGGRWNCNPIQTLLIYDPNGGGSVADDRPGTGPRTSELPMDVRPARRQDLLCRRR